MTVADYYKAIDTFAPFNLAESWDSVGLIVGGMDLAATRVMLALDITQKVIDEAVANNIQLIIAHHPLMFSGVKKLNSSSMEYQLVRNGISMIAAHTNLDIAAGGVNDVLCEKIGLKNLRGLVKSSSEDCYNIAVHATKASVEALYSALVENNIGVVGNYTGCGFLSSGVGRFTPMAGANPAIGSVGSLQEVEEIKLEFPVSQACLTPAVKVILENHPYETPVYTITKDYAKTENNYLGRIGNLEKPLSPKAFAQQIKSGLGCEGVQYTSLGRDIKKVAVCSGGGSGLMEDAIRAGVDAYVTGELRHDAVITANNAGLATFQGGHFATEVLVMEALKAQLGKYIENTDIMISKTGTDEIKFA